MTGRGKEETAFQVAQGAGSHLLEADSADSVRNMEIENAKHRG